MNPEIIYQDAFLVAVEKPSGMLSVPGRGPDKQDCVLTRLQKIFADIRIVHRLDCHTSGVMLLALGPAMQRELSRLFHDRLVSKTYVALVEGQVEADSGVIEIPLRGDPDDRPRQIVDPVNGKPALTAWRLLRRQSATTGETISRLQLRPITGRTHQLRVHCMAIGHPIVGDALYNIVSQRHVERMMLHAEQLEFVHPVDQVKLRLVSACDF